MHPKLRAFISLTGWSSIFYGGYYITWMFEEWDKNNRRIDFSTYKCIHGESI